MSYKIFIFIFAIIILSSHLLASSSISYYFDTTLENDTSKTFDLTSASVILRIDTDKPVSCRYSESEGIGYGSMEGIFDLNFETIHKKTLTGLSEGIHKYYILCRDSENKDSKELEIIFSVILPVSAQIILQNGSTVSKGMAKVNLVTSKVLSQTPSLSYSFDGISYNPVPIFGSGTQWTGYFIVASSSDKQVGSFKFQGKDLEGNTGTEITSGGVFIVDTQEPGTITDIKAESYDGRIDINWYLEEDEIDYFKIYKSTSRGVDNSDFYRTTESNSFSDTLVTRGSTYYYRVVAVDKAGNIGDLSVEVYATALLENTIVSSSGLEARFLGLVDNFLSGIDLVSDSLDSVKENFDQKDGKEKELYEDLKLEREIDSSDSELKSLRRDVDNFKSQSLTENELNKKLNSAQLKLNTIKKKIPENIIIISEQEESEEINENDIIKAILEITPDISERDKDKSVKKSLEFIEENEFSVNTKAYNLEIVYLDGTRKEMFLIKESVSPSLEYNENVSIIEMIPKEIAEDVLYIDIKNINYDVLKEDPIISFSSDTKEIIYSVKGKLNLDLVKKLKTIPLYHVEEVKKTNSLTGYFAFVDF
ncbi:MAG TPA: hypothetical protein ENG87_03385, partial [Candidatus Pacearchaeota archaeon]|nr:hypothetical protein [Candidatus Pacearchaeota archaeon]